MKITLKPFQVVCENSEAWAMDNTLTGICTSCGYVSEGECEPDASGYKCTECSENQVYGFSYLVMMGLVRIVD